MARRLLFALALALFAPAAAGAQFINAPLAGTSGTAANGYTDADGTVWTATLPTNEPFTFAASGGIYPNGTTSGYLYSSTAGHVPTAASYSVEADFTYVGAAGIYMGLVLNYDPSGVHPHAGIRVVSGAVKFFQEDDYGTHNEDLALGVNLTAGNTYHLKAVANGNQITVTVQSGAGSGGTVLGTMTRTYIVTAPTSNSGYGYPAIYGVNASSNYVMKNLTASLVNATATGYTLTGPSTSATVPQGFTLGSVGAAGVYTYPYTISLTGGTLATDFHWTPSGTAASWVYPTTYNSGTGRWVPSGTAGSVTITAGTTVAYFQVKAAAGAASGAYSISGTNDKSFTDPAALTQTIQPKIVIVDGDSKSDESYIHANWVTTLRSALPSDYCVVSYAISGQTMQLCNTNFAANVAPAYDSSRQTHYLFINAGTNDFANTPSPPTAATVAGYLQSYVQAAAAVGFRVAVFTCDPRTGTTSGDATYETLRQSYNTAIRSGWKSWGAYGIVDSSQIILGQPGSASIASYFYDGVHEAAAPMTWLGGMAAQTIALDRQGLAIGGSSSANRPRRPVPISFPSPRPDADFRPEPVKPRNKAA